MAKAIIEINDEFIFLFSKELHIILNEYLAINIFLDIQNY